MAEQKSAPLISSETLPTFVAVSFIIGLLAFSLSIWDFIQLRQVFHGLAAVSNVNTDATNTALAALDGKVTILENKITELQHAAAAATPPGEAPPMAVPPEGKAGKNKAP